jgi:large subunit ribosomal protein L22
MSPDTDKAAGGEQLSLSSKLDRKRARKAAHKRVVDLTMGKASARYVRITPTKARRVVNLVRGLDTEQAITTLKFAPQAASLPVRKVLQSAIYSLTDKREQAGLDTDLTALYVAEAYVDEGPTMKRFLPRAKGRADRILKRTSHITLVVREAEAAARKGRTGRAGQTGQTGQSKPAGRRGLAALGRRNAANRPAKQPALKKERTR